METSGLRYFSGIETRNRKYNSTEKSTGALQRNRQHVKKKSKTQKHRLGLPITITQFSSQLRRVFAGSYEASKLARPIDFNTWYPLKDPLNPHATKWHFSRTRYRAVRAQNFYQRWLQWFGCPRSSISGAMDNKPLDWVRNPARHGTARQRSSNSAAKS